MSKRSFRIDTTSLSTTKPVLDSGIYAGVISNASTKIGDNQTIAVEKEKVWNKNTKEREETGNWVIGGRFNYGATLTSKKAIQVLQRDEPKVFGGKIYLNFDQDYRLLNNHVLGALLETLGLHEQDFSELVDVEYEEDIAVPEELVHVPNIVDMLNSVNYHIALFEIIANSINLQPVLVKVKKQPKYKVKEILENIIDIGTSNAPFCGVLTYVAGVENDIEEV